MTVREKVRHIRSLPTTLETRDGENTGERIIAGYFAVFNEETELWPGAFEELSPGCIDLKIDTDVRGLVNHETTLVIGRTKSSTLKLRVDEKGLYGEIVINVNDTDAINIYERVKRGDVDQCSFGFEIIKENTDYREDGTVKWTLEEIRLYEVSVVTFPAYEATGVEARQKQVAEHEKRSLEIKKQKLKERMKSWL